MRDLTTILLLISIATYQPADAKNRKKRTDIEFNTDTVSYLLTGLFIVV